MADQRDDPPGKRPGADPAARALLSAVPADFLKALEERDGARDPRDPPAEAERKAGAAPESAPKPRPRPDPEPGEEPAESLLELMARAQIAWLGSGVRYWGELAELLGRRGARMADMARLSESEMSARDKLRLLDEARGYLREVGEISVREAQALSDDMAKLERALRKTMERPPAPGPKRHGRPTE